MNDSASPASRPSSPSPTSPPTSTFSFPGIVWQLVKAGTLLLFRLYLRILLVVCHQVVKIVNRTVITPLEPIFVQIRKVPKKDVSPEGVFYQFLRLQFLMALYLYPYFKHGLDYTLHPVKRLYVWAIRFVDGDTVTVSR